MRPVLMLAILGLCAACSSSQGSGNYRLERGMANYDALQRETLACKGKGGTLRPRPDTDLTELSSYDCVLASGAK